MYKIVSVLILTVACSAVPLDVEEDSLHRIANGDVAVNLQFPYAVSIQFTNNTQAVATRGHRCGGALITLQHVLTAASCMFEWNTDGTKTPINSNNYRVFAGANLLTNDSSADRFRTISRFIVHPDYHGIPSYANDIAIIVLTTPFPNTAVVPLSLPSAQHNPADFTDCVVAGWGVTAYGSVLTANVELKYANKYIYDQAMCTMVYNIQQGTPNILPSMVCASSYDIVTTGCNGDEGNALVCGNTLTGILALHGNCATASSYPEIYTRVSNYTAWIRPYTASASTFSSGASVVLFFTLMQMAFASLLS